MYHTTPRFLFATSTDFMSLLLHLLCSSMFVDLHFPMWVTCYTSDDAQPVSSPTQHNEKLSSVVFDLMVFFVFFWRPCTIQCDGGEESFFCVGVLRFVRAPPVDSICCIRKEEATNSIKKERVDLHACTWAIRGRLALAWLPRHKRTSAVKDAAATATATATSKAINHRHSHISHN
jgi:hypothetical protein